MYVKRRDKEKKDDFPFIISTNCPDFIYAFKEGGTWSHIQQYISHTHTHIPTGEQLCWQLTQIIVDYNRATNKQHLYNGRGDSLNKLGVEILGPIIHCPLKEMKEIKEKKRKIVNIYINLMVGTTLFQPIHIQGGGGKE